MSKYHKIWRDIWIHPWWNPFQIRNWGSQCGMQEWNDELIKQAVRAHKEFNHTCWCQINSHAFHDTVKYSFMHAAYDLYIFNAFSLQVKSQVRSTLASYSLCLEYFLVHGVCCVQVLTQKVCQKFLNLTLNHVLSIWDPLTKRHTVHVCISVSFEEARVRVYQTMKVMNEE